MDSLLRSKLEALIERWNSEQYPASEAGAVAAAVVRGSVAELRAILSEPEPSPNSNKAAQCTAGRQGDMGEGRVLLLSRQPDGDIVVTIMPMMDVTIEFCTPGYGAGRSPNTHAALCALLDAMVRDQRELMPLPEPPK